MKRNALEAIRDLYQVAVSHSRPANECGGVIEVNCSDGEAVYVSPAVLAVLMPWIKQGGRNP